MLLRQHNLPRSSSASIHIVTREKKHSWQNAKTIVLDRGPWGICDRKV